MSKRFQVGNRRQKSPQKRFLSILGLFMFIFYLIFGLLLLFWRSIPLNIDPLWRTVFGILLIVYAFIRFLRLSKS